MNHDLLIRGGTVVDGLMTPAYQADIAINDGKGAAIGRMTARGTEEIDAKGKVVAPGFVDMHTHMDGQLFWDPMASPSSLHGITSVMIANCGFALTPAKPAARDWVTSMLSRVEGIPLEALRGGLKFEWETYGEYLAALQRRKLGVNVGAMVPHSNIRYEVMGEDARKRAATAEERERIVAYLTSGMQAGGFGLSSSWNNGHADGDGIPVPSRFADREELLALATALRDFPVGGIEFTPRGLTEGLKSEDFSLLGDLSRGNRPSFTRAMEPGAARALLEVLAGRMARTLPVATGEFGAAMRVVVDNDGPVTILLDSRARG
jgi:N-acyl-D-aspartate/D-glutamate deacylase